MNRWLLAAVLACSSFLAGALFQMTGDNSPAIEAKQVEQAAFCSAVSDPPTIADLTQSTGEQENYLQTARRLVVFKKILSGARHFLVLYSESSDGAPVTA